MLVVHELTIVPECADTLAVGGRRGLSAGQCSGGGRAGLAHGLQGARRRTGTHSPGQPRQSRRLHLHDRRLSEPAQQHRDPRQLRLSCPTPARRPTGRCASTSTPRACSRRSTCRPTPTPARPSTCIWRSQTRPSRRSASSPSRGRSPSSTRATEGYVVSAASNVVVKVAREPDHRRRHRADRSARPDARARDPGRQEPARHRGQLERHPRLRDELRLARRHRDRSHRRRGSRCMATLRSASAARRRARSTDRIHDRQGALQHVGRRVRPAGAGQTTPITAACRRAAGAPARPVTPVRPVATTWCGSSPTGPRRTIPQHADFDQTDPPRTIMRVLNWSAERDEEEDFELNIRAVSGGAGLIVLADGVTPGSGRRDLRAARERRPQSAQGARRRRLGCAQGIRPVRHPRADLAGLEDRPGRRRRTRAVHRRQLPAVPRRPAVDAAAASASRRRPAAGAGRQRPDDRRAAESRARSIRRRSTRFARTAAAPLGADGFAPPSLLSIVRVPEDVPPQRRRRLASTRCWTNVTHRSAGTAGVDTLTNAADRAKIVRFLRSIDAATVPIF